jgi:hypothetical protein
MCTPCYPSSQIGCIIATKAGRADTSGKGNGNDKEEEDWGGWAGEEDLGKNLRRIKKSKRLMMAVGMCAVQGHAATCVPDKEEALRLGYCSPKVGPHGVAFVLPAFCKTGHIWQRLNEWEDGGP